MSHQEEWKDVVGYEAYFQVSNFGRVSSKRTNKVLKLHTMKVGYVIVTTKIGGRSGKAVSFRVHRIVAEAFLEKPSQHLVDKCSKEHFGKVIVRHKDHNKTNNHMDNLEWGSCQDNADDSKRDGITANAILKVCGTKSASSKLTDEDVKFIRENYKARDRRFGSRALSRLFGLHHTKVLDVVNMKSYKYN